MSQLSPEMSQLPESVHKVRKVRKIKQEELERAIPDLCCDEWIINTDMANILGREKRTLQRVLRPMVAHGLLESRFPEQISHPRQAYRSIRRKLKSVSEGILIPSCAACLPGLAEAQA